MRRRKKMKRVRGQCSFWRQATFETLSCHIS
jgi:hypothetical protein